MASAARRRKYLAFLQPTPPTASLTLRVLDYKVSSHKSLREACTGTANLFVYNIPTHAPERDLIKPQHCKNDMVCRFACEFDVIPLPVVFQSLNITMVRVGSITLLLVNLRKPYLWTHVQALLRNTENVAILGALGYPRLASSLICRLTNTVQGSEFTPQRTWYLSTRSVYLQIVETQVSIFVRRQQPQPQQPYCPTGFLFCDTNCQNHTWTRAYCIDTETLIKLRTHTRLVDLLRFMKKRNQDGKQPSASALCKSFHDIQSLWPYVIEHKLAYRMDHYVIVSKRGDFVLYCAFLETYNKRT